MKFISHRGRTSSCKSKSVDNSVQFLVSALSECSGIEVDVQLTKDGQIVMHHDLYVGNHFIKDCTYDFLRQTYKHIDLFKAFVDRLSDELLLTKIFVLDLKGSDVNLVYRLIEVFENKNTENVYFCSFNRNLTGHVPYKYKSGCTFETTLRSDEISDFIASHDAALIHWTSLSKELINACKQKNILVMCFTHKNDNEGVHIRQFKDVDYVISDVCQI